MSAARLPSWARASIPLAVALAGALTPVLSRAAGDEFKGAYGAASGSASAGASVSVSAGASASASAGASAGASASAGAGASSGASAGASASGSVTAGLVPGPKASASMVPGLTKAPPKEESPLVIPEGIKDTIGSSYTVDDRPTGNRVRSGLWPLAYKERIGGEITTAVFPFYYDRKVVDDDGKKIEQQSFYGLYYRKRSEKHDVDAAFPLLFRWRDEETTTTVVPPVLWRDGPDGEWHRWLAPLFFASSQPDGGYLHIPALLTFSHHNPKSAFSLIGGLGFYDRTGTDVDWGAFPFVFGGNDRALQKNYLLIPPLLTYHSEDRDLEKETWLVGPVYSRKNGTASIFDVFPLLFTNHGDDYSATTLLPFFHSSRNKDKRVFATPLFYSQVDDDGRTLVTPVYSRYRGRTSLDIVGPIIPLFAHYVDPDIHKESWLIGPTFYSSDPTGYSLFTPLFGQWREYGVSNTTWVFPTFEHESRIDGWSFNIHPLLYLGKNGDSFHDVLAPIWWDFVTPKTRKTVAFPLFWRFSDEEGVTQVALNTLYQERTSSKGVNYDFYFLPFVHVGEEPNGNAWDVLFGLVGYKRVGSYKQLKLFWIPIDLTANPDEALPLTNKKKTK